MHARRLASVGAATAVTLTAVLVGLMSVSTRTQVSTTSPRAEPAAAPQTSWGEPDLQGIWTDDFQTPLQRPTKYANRELLTDAEVAELDRQRAAQAHFGDRTAPAGTEKDVAGAYNSVFTSQKHTSRRTSLIVDPPDGRIPALTPEVQKMRAEMRAFQLALIQATDTCKNSLVGCKDGKYVATPSPRRNEPLPHYPMTGGIGVAAINRANGPEERGLSERCLSFGLPDFGGYRQIVQSPGAVSIFYDVGQGQGWQRIIPVTMRSHLPSTVRQWWGDSVAHWEGKTLVVDVANFSPKTDFQGSRQNLHLTERWTLTAPDRLEYIVTIEDATTWARPWTVRQEMTRQDDRANRLYKEPRCHEGNFGMIGILSNTRAEEQAFAEGRGPDPATRDNSVTGSTEETADLFQ
jgi:hypothetical protein